MLFGIAQNGATIISGVMIWTLVKGLGCSTSGAGFGFSITGSLGAVAFGCSGGVMIIVGGLETPVPPPPPPEDIGTQALHVPEQDPEVHPTLESHSSPGSMTPLPQVIVRETKIVILLLSVTFRPSDAVNTIVSLNAVSTSLNV